MIGSCNYPNTGVRLQPTVRLHCPITTLQINCNSNWTEWSTIQVVIARVVSKSDEHEARDRFEITSTITP